LLRVILVIIRGRLFAILFALPFFVRGFRTFPLCRPQRVSQRAARQRCCIALRIGRGAERREICFRLRIILIHPFPVRGERFCLNRVRICLSGLWRA
jgi:hypothetical protein